MREEGWRQERSRSPSDGGGRSFSVEGCVPSVGRCILTVLIERVLIRIKNLIIVLVKFLWSQKIYFYV